MIGDLEAAVVKYVCEKSDQPYKGKRHDRTDESNGNCQQGDPDEAKISCEIA
jgi:hypothetical protein